MFILVWFFVTASVLMWVGFLPIVPVRAADLGELVTATISVVSGILKFTSMLLKSRFPMAYFEG